MITTYEVEEAFGKIVGNVKPSPVGEIAKAMGGRKMVGTNQSFQSFS